MSDETPPPLANVLVTSRGPARVLTLNRPEAANSLDQSLGEELLQGLHDANSDPDARAVVITGAGRAFCAGQDLAEHARALRESGSAAFDVIGRRYAPLIKTIVSIDKVVIAGINGACAGAGLALALACDLRIAARSAAFSTAFTRVGLTADSGLSLMLPELIGLAATQRLMYMSERLTAEEVERLGMVHYVVDDTAFQAELERIADDIGNGPTRAYAATKRLLRPEQQRLVAALDLEADCQRQLGQTQDHRNAVTAFLDKTPLSFTGA